MKKYIVSGIFGSEAVSEFMEYGMDADLEFIDSDGEEMIKFFDTEAEARAYKQGIIDAIGYNDYAFTSKEEHKYLFDVEYEGEHFRESKNNS